MRIIRKYLNIILLIGITTWLTACGGSSGSSSSSETVSFFGRVATEANPGGEVDVKVNGIYKTGSSNPTTMTAADGTYTLTVEKERIVSIQFSKPDFITINTDNKAPSFDQIDFDIDPYPTTAAIQMVIDIATGGGIAIADKGWFIAEARDGVGNKLNGVSFLSTVPPEAEVYTLCDGTNSFGTVTIGEPCPARDIMYGAYFDAAALPVEIDVSVPGDVKGGPIRLGEITVFQAFVL